MQLNPQVPIPQHIALIMDGNGRWAKKQGHQRVFGHRHGVQAVRETSETCAELGVAYLTLYAFSTENWSRPKSEVNALMHLLVSTLHTELPTLTKNNIRLRAIGDLHALPAATKNALDETIAKTAHLDGMQLILALNYGGRDDILQASQRIARACLEGSMEVDQIDHTLFASQLWTKDIPDPDLMIRTSGELRLSNFLLWQLAYAELFFLDVLWPDFRKEHLLKAVSDYQSRERRFGKTSNQLDIKTN